MKILSTCPKQKKVLLVGVGFNNKNEILSSLEELESLCATDNLLTEEKTIQLIKEYTPATYIGKGKAEEIAGIVKDKAIDLVVFDNELTGSQITNLENIINVKVIDRSMLILDIFAMRAKTDEGKLQVDLAQLKYSLPRTNALSGSSGRFGSGGVGSRGPGETRLEINKRVVREKIFKLAKKQEELSKQRQLRREKRDVSTKKRVAIIGYTNAGKSTLMNTITKAGIFADDMLFATLDTTTRSIWLDNNKEILLTDTVGFISKLPHEFIEAFKSTLDEVKYSDLLLHVVDASSSIFDKQIKTVNEVIKSLGADNIPCIMVYNKIDKVTGEQSIEGIKVSASKNINIDVLKNEIIKKLF